MKSVSLLTASAAIAAGFVLPATAQPVAPQTVPPLAFVEQMSPYAVEAVQNRLQNSGAYAGPVDGVWGPDSQAALERFQSAHQLQPTGTVNEVTATALGLNPNDLLTSQQPAMVPATNLRPAAVRAMQDRLRRLGYYNGPDDGVWGPGTQAAVQRFQQDKGIAPNGDITSATLGAMGLDWGVVAYQ